MLFSVEYLRCFSQRGSYICIIGRLRACLLMVADFRGLALLCLRRTLLVMSVFWPLLVLLITAKRQLF